jgi:DNA polymerase V
VRLKNTNSKKISFDLEPIVDRKRKVLLSTRSFPNKLLISDLLRNVLLLLVSRLRWEITKNKPCHHNYCNACVDKHTSQTQYYFTRRLHCRMGQTSPFLMQRSLAAGKTTSRKWAFKILRKRRYCHWIDWWNKQLQLFDEENPKHLLLMKVMDGLNKKDWWQESKAITQNLSLTWTWIEAFVT